MSEKDLSKVAGGLARAEALSDEEKRAIAKQGAQARWGLKATHRGNFMDDFGIDVDCFVLNDEKKTAVISQTQMGKAIGLSSRGNAFPRFASGKAIAKHLGAELLEKIGKPLKFQWGFGGAGQPPTEVNGYDVTLLIDVCKAVLAADAAAELADNQRNVPKQSRIILNASAKSGIQGLVYKLAGYDATREEVIAAFKFFVREEAREYEREFPAELYNEWYRLYQMPRPARNHPWKFKHLTEAQVYEPLARSNGKILELTRAKRGENKGRGKLHQFLSEIGVKALRVHLGKLTGIAAVSDSREDYERHFRKVFGQQLEMFEEPPKPLSGAPVT